MITFNKNYQGSSSVMVQVSHEAEEKQHMLASEYSYQRAFDLDDSSTVCLMTPENFSKYKRNLRDELAKEAA